MDSKMRRVFWIPFFAGLLLSTGCGGGQSNSDNSATAKNGAGNNTPGQLVATQSPNLKVPSDAKEVVALFLDSMRQGNGAQLSALLSTAAREEIRRRELVIDPLGSPAAQFKIGEAVAEQDGMLVSTMWIEPATAESAAAELEVVWELRKEPAGWRICGMAVDPRNGDEVQIVNFESMAPDEPAPPEQRTAALPGAVGTQPPASLGGQIPTPSLPNQVQQQGGYNGGFPVQQPGMQQPGMQQPGNLAPMTPVQQNQPPAPIQSFQGLPSALPNGGQMPQQSQLPSQPQFPQQPSSGGFQLPPATGSR
jgi:hypothetical protein